MLCHAEVKHTIIILYASALYGYNNSPPVTSSAATVMQKNMMEYFGIDEDDAGSFNRVYRGLEKVSHGKAALNDHPGFCENTSLEPISEDANRIQDYASKAYHGGICCCIKQS